MQTSLYQASFKQTSLCSSSSLCSAQTSLCQVSPKQTSLCSSSVQTSHCQAFLKQTILCSISQNQCFNINFLYSLNSSNILPSSIVNVLYSQNITHLLQ